MRVICQLLVIPRVRILGPDKSRGLFQAVRKFGITMTRIMYRFVLALQTYPSEHVYQKVHEPGTEEHFSVM